MATNRIQMQRGLSMHEFMQRHGTEAQCEAALATARWPDGLAFARRAVVDGTRTSNTPIEYTGGASVAGTKPRRHPVRPSSRPNRP